MATLEVVIQGGKVCRIHLVLNKVKLNLLSMILTVQDEMLGKSARKM